MTIRSGLERSNLVRFMPKFMSLKEVPTLSWSSPRALTFKPPFSSVVFLVIGLTLFGIGDAMLIAAGVGVSPWTVLAQGIAHIMSWSIGFTTFIVSLLVLICWVPLKQVPGLGTILNAIIISLVLEYLLPFMPVFDNLALQITYAFFGVLVTGFGGGLYLIANLGPGPRDGLMTGLQKVTGFPIARVRGGIEITVLACGWLLGGSVGIGTLLFAFGIGPSVALSMHIMKKMFGNVDATGH